jgi:hypothetical protein
MLMLGIAVSPCAMMAARRATPPLWSADFTGATLPAGLTFARDSSAWQFNAAGVLTEYATDVPRLNAVDGIYAEEQRTNIVLTTPAETPPFKATGGALSFSTVGLDGVTNANTFTENTSTGAHGFESASGFNVSSGGQRVTVSAFLKAGTETVVQTYLGFMFPSGGFTNFDLASGVIGNKAADAAWIGDSFGGGWRRVALTDVSTTSGARAIYFRGTDNNTAAGYIPSYTGTGKIFTGWAEQAENGYGATSFIPTSGTAVTRNAESITMEDPTLINPTIGKIIINAKTAPFHDGTSQVQTLFAMSNGTETVTVQKNAAGNLTLTGTGFTSSPSIDAGAVGVDATVTVTIEWNVDGWKLNGGSGSGDVFSSELTGVSLGHNIAIANHWNGRIKSLGVY